MLKIAIVEDDKAQVNVLKSMLGRYFSENDVDAEIDLYYDGMELLKSYNIKYDIILLDIEMPILGGMQTAEAVRKMDNTVQIIFVTNMSQFAVKGYEVDATAFIVKPVKYFSLSIAMKKAINYVSNKASIDIIVTTRQGIIVVPSSSIIYIEISKHDLIYHTEQGKIEHRGSLKEIESKLNELNFARCSSCYLVNLRYVKSIMNNAVFVNNTTLPVSRGKKKEFVDHFLKYIGGEKNATIFS